MFRVSCLRLTSKESFAALLNPILNGLISEAIFDKEHKGRGEGRGWETKRRNGYLSFFLSFISASRARDNRLKRVNYFLEYRKRIGERGGRRFNSRLAANDWTLDIERTKEKRERERERERVDPPPPLVPFIRSLLFRFLSFLFEQHRISRLWRGRNKFCQFPLVAEH